LFKLKTTHNFSYTPSRSLRNLRRSGLLTSADYRFNGQLTTIWSTSEQLQTQVMSALCCNMNSYT